VVFGHHLYMFGCHHVGAGMTLIAQMAHSHGWNQQLSNEIVDNL